jgi:signal transduction histidine kinase
MQYAVAILANTEDAEVLSVRSRLVTLMQGGLARMAELLHSLEALSRAREGRDGPTVQVVEVGAIAREVARQLADVAAGRGVAIRIAPDLPTVAVDVARLELVLMNLVSNAIKYSDPAKPERVVEIDAVAGPGDTAGWTLRVRDNGLGIPDDVLPRLLHTRFLRAHSDRDQELGNEGAGLGLSIVHECVASLGGEVTLTSVEGEGTTGLVKLPPRG